MKAITAPAAIPGAACGRVISTMTRPGRATRSACSSSSCGALCRAASPPRATSGYSHKPNTQMTPPSEYISGRTAPPSADERKAVTDPECPRRCSQPMAVT